MGKIRMGPPQSLVLFLKEKAGAGHFVETGTFKGDTAAWAGGHFARVFTVELSADYHAAAVKRFAGSESVKPLKGNSAQVLAELMGRIEGPGIFWLDAHWSGLDTSGREAECPLIEEVALINASPAEHVVMVDDARLFCAPPPAPHRAEDWPDLLATVQVLSDRGRRHVILHHDVLVAVPMALKEGLVEFVRRELAENRKSKPWWRRLMS